jgi:hypothetical protein
MSDPFRFSHVSTGVSGGDMPESKTGEAVPRVAGAWAPDDRVLVGVVIASYFMITLYFATPLMPMMGSGTFLWLSTSAWTGIQAIGSIVAIFSAGLFIRWQVGAHLS